MAAAADKDIEKRFAALEKRVKSAEARAESAEARAAELERSHKELKAHARDRQYELREENRRLNSMRELHGPESPYAENARDKYEQLKRATVKTKDGRRHYYSELASYVSDGPKGAATYHPPGSFISVPADQDPSLTWKPVKVGGKDPKTGALVFLLLDDSVEEVEEDPSQQLDGDAPVTNTELNRKAEQARLAKAQLGAGAPAKPTPPPAPGANELDDETDEGARSGDRPSDTEVG
jgi:Maltoporin periplasmic N-terminal extension